MNLEEFEQRLHAAMEEVASLNAGGIQIHNRRYTTVAKRMEVFRKHFGVHGKTRIAEEREANGVIDMRAVVELREDVGDAIRWVEHAEGRAEEARDASQVNRTSARENCETSAYGRALAAFGLHGGEYASANEVQNAVHQQSAPQASSDSRGDGSLPLRPTGDFGYGKKYPTTPWNLVPSHALEWFLTAERVPLMVREKCETELAWRRQEADQMEAAREHEQQRASAEDHDNVPF
jgi:hypothetical protein